MKEQLLGIVALKTNVMLPGMKRINEMPIYEMNESLTMSPKCEDILRNRRMFCRTDMYKQAPEPS